MVSRAVSTWSLHRVLGSFRGNDVAPGGMLRQAAESPNGSLALLDLPAELRSRGYDAVHICHFHLPSRDAAYLSELRAALAEAGIALDALLIDDGDLTDATAADAHERWIGEWLDVAAGLGAKRARVSAGWSTPSPERLRESAHRLRRLAADHAGVRLVTENWQGMMSDADAVLAILDQTEGDVGLLIDLGNWRGADTYEQLRRIAPFAETCHAKCHFVYGQPDREDFLTTLRILKDARFDGPLALIYEGENEWASLDTEYAIVREAFG